MSNGAQTGKLAIIGIFAVAVAGAAIFALTRSGDDAPPSAAGTPSAATPAAAAVTEIELLFSTEK